MRRRRVKLTTILTDDEVREVVRGIRTVFGDQFAAMAESRGIDLEQSVRFRPVGKRCEERRCARGLSVKDVAKQLKVPQFRLRDIEAGRFRSIQPPVLAAYVSHLRLRRWYRRWERSSPELARLVAPKSGADGESLKRKAR